MTENGYDDIMEIDGFTEWKNLDDDSLRNSYGSMVESGEIAIVMKTGLRSWYCGYTDEEEFPGKVLFIRPPFWKGTSFPNSMLMEAVKSVGYLLAGDKVHALQQMLKYSQVQTTELINSLNVEHTKYAWDYLEWHKYDDSLILATRAMMWKLQRKSGMQDEILHYLNKDQEIFEERLASSHVEEIEKEFDMMNKTSEKLMNMTFAEFTDSSKHELEAIRSLEEETVHIIKEIGDVQSLLPIRNNSITLDDYQDIPGICKAYTVDRVLEIMRWHSLEMDSFYFEMFMED